MFLRHFNELDHEILNRLNKAYIPAVKYMDLFVLPIATILARWGLGRVGDKVFLNCDSGDCAPVVCLVGMLLSLLGPCLRCLLY